jgi:hypothetical protein
MKATTLSLISSVLFCYSNTLIAQPSETSFVDVSQCVVFEDPDQRYACFDEVTAHLRNEQTSADQQQLQERDSLPVFQLPRRQAQGEVQQEPENDVANNEEASSADPVEDFGNRTARVEVNDAGDSMLHDRIVSLREREPNQFLITLESGQVWYQTINKRFRLKEGMNVVIAPSPVGGSFRLRSPDAKGFIQVRRIE